MGRNAYCVGSCWAHDCPFYHGLITYGVPEARNHYTLSSIVLATHSFQFKPRGRPVISALCCTRPNEMTSRPRPTKRRERGEGGAIESDCNFNFTTIGPVKIVKLETDHKGRRRRHHQHPSVRPSGISLSTSSRRLCRTLAPCVWRGVVHSVADGAFPAELRIPLRSTTRIPAMRQNSPREGRNGKVREAKSRNW